MTASERRAMLDKVEAERARHEEFCSWMIDSRCDCDCPAATDTLTRDERVWGPGGVLNANT